MQPAGFGIEKILPHPEDRPFSHLPLVPSFSSPQREAERKACRGGEVGGLGSMDLVQRRPREPAIQHRIEGRHAEPDPSGRSWPCPQSRLGEAAAQIGQGWCGGCGHGNGQLFTLCSFIKCSFPEGESSLPAVPRRCT